MKKSWLLRLLLLLVMGLAVGRAQGQRAQPGKEEPVGLASFKFGSTWTDLRPQAIREYGLEKIKAGPDCWRQPKDKGKLFISFQSIAFDDEPSVKELVIDHYVVAGKEYEVHFVFDSKERFYAYRMIEIPSVDLKDYDAVVGERLRRWQGVYGEQFGAATENGKLPNPQDLKSDYTVVTTWKFKKHTASVGVFHLGRSYNAQAVVGDDALAAEEAARKEKEGKAVEE